MYRYLAFIWRPESTESARYLDSVLIRLRAAATSWQVALRIPGALVLHTDTAGQAPQVRCLARQTGVVLGTLFDRSEMDGRLPGTEFDTTETQRILQTGGRHLVDNYWGAYVAITQHRANDHFRVLREPLGSLPCFHTKLRDIAVFCSHIADYVACAPVTFSINWKHIAAHLLVNEHLTRASGLMEVEDIPGGESVIISRMGISREVLWHPASFCRDRRFEAVQPAAQVLRSTVQSVVNSWASHYNSAMLKLSGGLDSSIVAGCLAQSPIRSRTSCINFFSHAIEDEGEEFSPTPLQHPEQMQRMPDYGDEREYARLVCHLHKLPLLELQCRSDDIALKSVWDAPLAPRPSQYVYNICQDALEIEAVRNSGVAAFFTGLGGDAMFYSTSQPYGAVDHAWRRPFDPGLFKAITESSKLSGKSVWHVLSKAVRHGYLRRPVPLLSNSLGGPNLLTADALDWVSNEDTQHPWLHNTVRVTPGKLDQITNIVSAGGGLFYSRAFRRDELVPTINPLTAQPVVELCLAIPTHVLLDGGVSRGLARGAFSDVLPPRVRDRRVKGRPRTLWHRIIHRNVSFVRERLLDGVLVREGLLDRPQLERYLVDSQTFQTVNVMEILGYLAAEAWLQQWTMTARLRAAA